MSGSGKSNLILRTLAPALEAALRNDGSVSEETRSLLQFADLSVDATVRAVVTSAGSQATVTKNSLVATYSGVAGPLRELFAVMPDSA